MAAQPTRETLIKKIQALETRQEELLRSERWLEGIFNALAEAVFVVDPNGNIIKMNIAGRKMFGYAEKEVVGGSTEMLHVDRKHYERFVELIGKAFSSGRMAVFEFELKRKSGRTFPSEHTVSFLKSDRNERIGMVSVVRDLSGEKGARNLIRAGEKKFRTSMETVLDCFGLYSAIRDVNGNIEDFRIEYVNRTACEDIQMSRKDPTGKRLCRLLPGYRRSGLFDAYCRVVETGIPFVRRAFTYDDGSQHADLKRIFDIRAVRLGDGFVATWRDVTENEKLREESRQHLEQAIRADRLAALGEVVAGVAHEINNPNSFITFNLPLLKDIWGVFRPIVQEYAQRHPDVGIGRIPLEELCQDMDDILNSLRKGSERISQVVGKLKNFALPDEAQRAEPTHLNKVVEDTMAIFSGKLKQYADHFSFDLGEDLPEIPGYPFKLEQVLANLILNASNAVDGISDARVNISTRRCENLNAVLLEVRDFGRGMDRSEIKKIFDPFYTTRRKEGGSGLGLSISHKILKEHRGIMGVLSKPGVGSRFTVFLPAKSDIELALDPYLLIIDDDISVLKLLESRYLRLDKRFVHTLSEPASVVAYLSDHPEVDLVMSDILMPRMTGWKLLKEVKRFDPLMPVILYSGVQRALENPFDDLAPDLLLAKPFHRETLIKSIHQICRLKI